MVQYLIRLDDLCPTNNLKKWERFFTLFDRFGIKPMIAVIPENKDPKLLNGGNFNPLYWDLVRELQRKNYTIGMHGYDHRYLTHQSGFLKMNRRSEFAGMPYLIQEEKIRAAAAVFKREHINTDIFIAPAHSFDHNTLLALKKCTGITTISDGLLKSPYSRLGFNWIPVQLSEVEQKTDDTWTFNYHPETCSNSTFHELELFVEKNNKYFVTPEALKFKVYSWQAGVTESCLITIRLLKSTIKKMVTMLEKIAAP